MISSSSLVADASWRKMITSSIFVILMISSATSQEKLERMFSECEVSGTRTYYVIEDDDLTPGRIFSSVFGNKEILERSLTLTLQILSANGSELYEKILPCRKNCTDALWNVPGDFMVPLNASLFIAKMITESSCYIRYLNVQSLGSEENSCEEEVKTADRTACEMVADDDAFNELLCNPKDGNLKQKLMLLPSTRVVWYKNCRPINSSNFSPFSSGEKLRFNNVTLTDTPAMYSCKVITPNNKSFFVMHRPVCVKARYLDGNIASIVCENVTVSSDQTSVTLSCSGEMSVEKSEPFRARWYKKNNTDALCEATEEKKDCSIDVEENQCYGYPTFEDISTKSTSTFIANFTLNTSYGALAGEYIFSFTSIKINSRITFNVKVVENGSATKLAIALGVIAGTLMFVLFVLMLMNIFWVEVRYYSKLYLEREIPANFEQPYLVYLSYIFHTSLPSPVQAVTKEILKCLHLHLDNMNCRYYDPEWPQKGYFDHNEVGDCIGPAALKIINKSHSFLMVITEDIIKEKEWLLELRNLLALTENAIGNLKIVFLCTPSALKLLEKKARKKDEICVTIKRFMMTGKTSVIKSKVKKMSSHRFYKMLYLALPKVEKFFEI